MIFVCVRRFVCFDFVSIQKMSSTSLICRLCLSTDSNFSIVQPSEQLFMDIFELVQIQLFDIPGIAATVVCDLCESKVAEFMEFKRICITSNDRLANKELLKLETSIEQPTQIWCQNENEYQAKSVDDDRNHLSAIADVPNNEVTKLDKKTKFDREVCSYCGKTFLFLSQHIKSMHSRTLSNTKKYTCGLCFEKFTERSLLKVHVGSIHDGKMFHCDICGKRDKTLGGLARHIRSHSKIRPYSCELCGKLFRYSKHLFEHKLRHENNRRFSCEICSKKFFTHTEISSHRLIHANDRSFKCTECGKGFKRPDHVRSHMRIHLKDKSFACKICEKEFSFKHNMVFHMKNVHGTLAYNSKN